MKYLGSWAYIYGQRGKMPEYWCHNCSKPIIPTHTPEDDLQCQDCNEYFIEEIDPSDPPPGYQAPPRAEVKSAASSSSTPPSASSSAAAAASNALPGQPQIRFQVHQGPNPGQQIQSIMSRLVPQSVASSSARGTRAGVGRGAAPISP